MDKNILGWELASAIFIITMGTLLHFIYEWSGYWKPAAVIAAVNESVWEHLKLGFWPLLIFSMVEYAFISEEANNFFIAKAVALILVPLTIIIIFYAYTAVLGDHYFVLDILTFVTAVVIGQSVSYDLLTLQPLPDTLNTLALEVIVMLALIFPVFTFFPPRIFLFRNPLNGGYGIPE